jgi:hypothetical protein
MIDGQAVKDNLKRFENDFDVLACDRWQWEMYAPRERLDLIRP